MADTKISGLPAVTSLLGTDELVLARSATTKKISGADLAAAVGGGGGGGAVEHAYAQITAAVSVTVTAEASGVTLVTAPAVTMDGLTTVVVEFFAPWAYTHTALNASLVLNLWTGTTNLGRLALIQTPASTGSMAVPLSLSRRLTPTAGSHTYSIRAYTSAGTATVGAGAGGVGAWMPAYLRVLGV